VGDVTGQLACPECSAPMVRRTSRWGRFYGCSRWPACNTTHGAHPDGRPLGVPANAATRAARVRAHAAFDALAKARGWTRGEAYRWLAARLYLDRRECHIARFDAARCAFVVELCEGEPRQ
jgi:ssDNA-binding Zn-finger/Zn-ribbon topoisomerase 1